MITFQVCLIILQSLKSELAELLRQNKADMDFSH